jgi:ABC-type Zn2+ transport system substrate-binding protein/surface adhesin
MPQPVDLQTEMGRLTAADRIQQIADRVSLAAQQRTAQVLEKERLSEETQVQQTREAESEEVDAEGQGRNPAAGRRHHRHPEQNEGDEEAHVFYNAEENQEIAEQPEGHNFDVTI